MGFLKSLFTSDGFMPHGMCYLWNPAVICLHVISDAIIAIAYYSIPITLVYFVRKRKDLVFDWMFLCFAAFIVACGTTHVMEIINIYYPNYWLSGVIKAFTAIVSIITAVLLIRIVPKALTLPSPRQLREANEALQREVIERKEALGKVGKLNDELILQKAQLETANNELETFAYSVSHDLRAPLRHIDGFVELLREESGGSTAEGRRYMQVIADSAAQMGLLIDNLLAFSRMGRAGMTPKDVDCNKLVEEVRNEFVLETKGRNVEWHIDPLPTVHADPQLLKQVWANLIGNAIKYTRQRDKAVITIRCREDGKEEEFSIEDNGAGFDMQYAGKLFGIFQRLHFREEFEGTGIGLANVRRIVARHGGRTWAHGEVNKGATFYFTIPRTTRS